MVLFWKLRLSTLYQVKCCVRGSVMVFRVVLKLNVGAWGGMAANAGEKEWSRIRTVELFKEKKVLFLLIFYNLLNTVVKMS